MMPKEMSHKICRTSTPNKIPISYFKNLGNKGALLSLNPVPFILQNRQLEGIERLVIYYIYSQDTICLQTQVYQSFT